MTFMLLQGGACQRIVMLLITGFWLLSHSSDLRVFGGFPHPPYVRPSGGSAGSSPYVPTQCSLPARQCRLIALYSAALVIIYFPVMVSTRFEDTRHPSSLTKKRAPSKHAAKKAASPSASTKPKTPKVVQASPAVASLCAGKLHCA